MFNYSQDYPWHADRRRRRAGPGPRAAGREPELPDQLQRGAAATEKHRVHRWLTAPMPAPFTSTTRSAMTVWTRTVNAQAGEATLCVAMHKVNAAGAVVGGPLATATHRIESWPIDATQISFAFNHSGTAAASRWPRSSASS